MVTKRTKTIITVAGIGGLAFILLRGVGGQQGGGGGGLGGLLISGGGQGGATEVFGGGDGFLNDIIADFLTPLEDITTTETTATNNLGQTAVFQGQRGVILDAFGNPIASTTPDIFSGAGVTVGGNQAQQSFEAQPLGSGGIQPNLFRNFGIVNALGLIGVKKLFGGRQSDTVEGQERRFIGRSRVSKEKREIATTKKELTASQLEFTQSQGQIQTLQSQLTSVISARRSELSRIEAEARARRFLGSGRSIGDPFLRDQFGSAIGSAQPIGTSIFGGFLF